MEVTVNDGPAQMIEADQQIIYSKSKIYEYVEGNKTERQSEDGIFFLTQKQQKALRSDKIVCFL